MSHVKTKKKKKKVTAPSVKLYNTKASHLLSVFVHFKVQDPTSLLNPLSPTGTWEGPRYTEGNTHCQKKYQKQDNGVQLSIKVLIFTKELGMCILSHMLCPLIKFILPFKYNSL